MTDYLKSKYIFEDKISIGEIPAILFRPQEYWDKIPTIILYHGWSSSKKSQRMRGFILSSVGYQVVIPDAIYHGDRNPLHTYDLDNARKYFWDIIFNNLEESEIIIDKMISKYDADPNRIGVIGNSMGGFTAAGIFTHNPSLKALVVFNGSCSWEIFNKRHKEHFKLTDGEELERFEERVKKLDPINNLNLLKDRPILLLHGDSDSLVPVESQRIFYSKIKPLYEDKDNIKFIEYHNLNHFVTTNMMEESINWLGKYL